MLATLQRQLALGLALNTFQAQDDLLRGLGLLVEDGLGLTTVTALLAVVTALTLGEEGSLAGLVLGHLVLGVLAALLALAVGVAGLGNVDLRGVRSAGCSWGGGGLRDDRSSRARFRIDGLPGGAKSFRVGT